MWKLKLIYLIIIMKSENNVDKKKMMQQIQQLKLKYLKKNQISDPGSTSTHLHPPHPTSALDSSTNSMTQTAITNPKPSFTITPKFNPNTQLQSKDNKELHYQNSMTPKQLHYQQSTPKQLQKAATQIIPNIEEIDAAPKQQTTKKALASSNVGIDPIRNIIAKQNRTQTQPRAHKQFYQQIYPNFSKDPFQLWAARSIVHPKTIIEQTDPQFQASSPVISPKNRVQNTPRQLNIKEICHKWKYQSSQAITYIFFNDQQILTLKLLRLHRCQNQPQFDQEQPLLESRNPKLPILMKQTLLNFVFNYQRPLSKTQQQLIYNIALQYFTPSAHRLSDVLLLCLVKLGKNYIQIYADEILKHICEYLPVFVRYRKYYLKEEEEQFIDCLIIGYQNRVNTLDDSENIGIWLLLLRPQSPMLHQILLPTNLCAIQYLKLFSAISPQQNGTPLSFLYLKCLDQLTSLFTQQKIIENVIEHLNKIKVPEALYKPTKSLKLKMIKQSDKSTKNIKNDEEKGFMSYLNDRISRLKDKAHKQLGKEQKERRKVQLVFDAKQGKYIEKIISQPN